MKKEVNTQSLLYEITGGKQLNLNNFIELKKSYPQWNFLVKEAVVKTFRSKRSESL